MMETLFLKRFESSWISCLKTIENVLAAHENALAKIDAFQTAGTDSDAQTDAEEDEDSESSDITLGKKNPVRLADMGTNISVFRADVEKDIIVDIFASKTVSREMAEYVAENIVIK